MNPTSLIWILVALALVVWIGIRQLTWQALTPRGAWTMPIVLLAIAAVSGASELRDVHPDAVGVGLLALELAVSVATGALMGRLARFRRLPEGSMDRRGDRAVWETRTGGIGLAIWIVLIAFRIGVDVWAQIAHVGGGLLSASAVILVLLALNRLTRSGVLQLRLGRAEFAPAA